MGQRQEVEGLGRGAFPPSLGTGGVLHPGELEMGTGT